MSILQESCSKEVIMIITFSVQNFRSIRDKVTLDFRATADHTLEKYYVYATSKPKVKILKMAMIFGANASGKTNILMALDFLRFFIVAKEADKDELIDVDAFALDKAKDTIFEIEFLHNDIIYLYKLCLNQKFIQSEQLYHYPKGTKSTVFERKLIINGEYKYSYNWTGATLNSEQKKFLEITIQNQSILSRLKSIQYSGPIQYARDWFLSTLAPIVEPRTKLITYGIQKYVNNPQTDQDYRSFYLNLLKKADFLIDDISIEKDEIRLSELKENVREYIINQRKLNGDKNPAEEVLKTTNLLISHHSGDDTYRLNINDESAGTQRYFELIGLLCELLHRQRVVPIDELESSLHIDLMTHFIQTFLRNSSRGQLIFTSHNTAILNEREILRRDTIWITNRKPDGSTELNPITDYPVRKEHAIDKLYRKGLLGGLPNLGSTMLDVEDDSENK